MGKLLPIPLEHRDSIDKVFITDGSDVVMLRNPFEKMKDGVLYVGDEPNMTGCEWMVKTIPIRTCKHSL